MTMHHIQIYKGYNNISSLTPTNQVPRRQIMTQTFFWQSGEGNRLGVGHLSGLILVGDEDEVHCVGEIRLEITKVHLVIVMVEQLAKLGDLKI